MKKNKLEVIPDRDMYEKGTKGETSYVFNRCNKANNKYLKCYNPK